MKYKRSNVFDIVIIGGGFYGCVLAIFLKKYYKKILIIEKESRLLTKASYFNQARVHNGYHYPRSFITAKSSHQNFKRFCKDFEDAVFDGLDSIYAIARNNSKITSNQFYQFCLKIGAPIALADLELKKLFNPYLIEQVYKVQEFVFSGNKIRHILKQELQKSGIKVMYSSVVEKVSQGVGNKVHLDLNNGSMLQSSIAINCTYAGINKLLSQSALPTLPIKIELTEMPLVQVPKLFQGMGITVMDGPFFSLLPFPDRKAHTIHHVRYTPLHPMQNKSINRPSYFPFILRDVQRYIPSLSKATYQDSIIQEKAILVSNESNDGRPILFHKDYCIKNFHVILGGKLDNVYDVLETITIHGL